MSQRRQIGLALGLGLAVVLVWAVKARTAAGVRPSARVLGEVAITPAVAPSAGGRPGERRLPRLVPRRAFGPAGPEPLLSYQNMPDGSQVTFTDPQGRSLLTVGPFRYGPAPARPGG